VLKGKTNLMIPI